MGVFRQVPQPQTGVKLTPESVDAPPPFSPYSKAVMEWWRETAIREKPQSRIALPGWSVDNPPILVRLSDTILDQWIVEADHKEQLRSAALPGWSVDVPPPLLFSPAIGLAWQAKAQHPIKPVQGIFETVVTTDDFLKRPGISGALEWWLLPFAIVTRGHYLVPTPSTAGTRVVCLYANPQQTMTAKQATTFAANSPPYLVAQCCE